MKHQGSHRTQIPLTTSKAVVAVVVVALLMAMVAPQAQSREIVSREKRSQTDWETVCQIFKKKGIPLPPPCATRAGWN
ncbi:hypothetical protein ElyMa_001768900 [Elysia marginata]|uniref:Uncharacterized protein n=1 Tax=Elysia marginata TaxID=1093978 RepID=A0AAV4EBX0_9GAST|nr:hypothetical protein ElyMa_001768900 [Elysia marginata]